MIPARSASTPAVSARARYPSRHHPSNRHHHGRIPSARLHRLVHTAVESLHHRSEMVRGCPLGVVAILVDDDTPAEALAQQISRGVGLIPDGCAVLHWQDVCALGIRPAAYATRL